MNWILLFLLEKLIKLKYLKFDIFFSFWFLNFFYLKCNYQIFNYCYNYRINFEDDWDLLDMFLRNFDVYLEKFMFFKNIKMIINKKEVVEWE